MNEGQTIEGFFFIIREIAHYIVTRLCERDLPQHPKRKFWNIRDKKKSILFAVVMTKTFFKELYDDVIICSEIR